MDLNRRGVETERDRKVTESQREIVRDRLSHRFRTRREVDAYIRFTGWFGAWFASEIDACACLTEDEKAIAAAPLTKQAELLGLEIESISVSRGEKGFSTGRKAFLSKEKAVAAWYSENSDSRESYSDEGQTARVLLHLMYDEAATSIPYIGDYPYTGLRSFWFVTHFRERFFNVEPGDQEHELSQDFLARLQSTNLPRYRDEQYVRRRLVEERRKNPADIAAGHPRMASQVARLAQVTEENFWNRIILQKVKYGPFTTGWPDVTLVSPESVEFVEVKDKDKMHQTQIAWWLRVAADTGLKGRIAKVFSSGSVKQLRVA